MTSILVKASSHEYPIAIGENIRFELLERMPKTYTTIMIITDESVAKLYLNDIKSNFKTEHVVEAIIPVGEKSKSMKQYEILQTIAIENGLDRHSLIIALGGGVVGDLAGFVAATFLRGIDYIQIPTTILAHDSSVGGKVAINHEYGKNLIGSFYAPQAVVYDVETLKSLPIHEIRSGYAELMKEALISNDHFLQKILNTYVTDVPNDILQEHLQEGIKVKATIVEADEKEASVRMYLNLGHTLGHALEADLGYGVLTHGEAIAIGLLFSLRVSEQIYNVSLPYDAVYDWFIKNNYPIHLDHLNIDQLINHMKRDKKVVNEHIQMVLLKAVGEPIITQIQDEDLRMYLESFKEKLVK